MRFASVLLLAAGTLASVLLTPGPAAAWHRRGRCAAPPACCPVAAPTCCDATGYHAPPGYYAPPYGQPMSGQPMGAQPMPGYQPPAPLPAKGATGTATISLTDDRFDPPTLTVAAGTTVRWVNNGQHLHTVTSEAGRFDSGDLKPGQEYTATFYAGTTEYHCRHHPAMKGTIVVK